MKAYLDPGEVQLLEESASCLRDRLLVRLLFHVGCRVSEALGLTIDDIDFGAGLVTIQHLKTRLHLSCPGCGSSLGRSSQYCQKCGLKVTEAVARQMERRRRRNVPA